MKKTFVIDTNVLLMNPYALYSFEDNEIIIPDVTLETLDRRKTNPGEVGANARETIRILEALRQQGDFHKGIQLPGKGSVRIEMNHLNVDLPPMWNENGEDNRILRICKGLREDGSEVILVTNDINMRIKASLLTIPSEEYKADKLSDKGKRYRGRQEADIPGTLIDALYTKGELTSTKLHKYLTQQPIVNEYYLLRDKGDESHTALAQFDGKKFVLLKSLKVRPWDIVPKNVGQTFSIDALMAPADLVPLVILSGGAGTGKTLLSLAAALETTINQNTYDHILCSRPATRFDDDVGFLPGSEQEKIDPLLRPIYDNLAVLTKVKDADRKNGERTNYVQDLFERGVISAQAMAFMRGRSITNNFVIIDEAQNLTPNQIFGVISRCGFGTKIVITGDPSQIDKETLDQTTNGLVYLSERMKGSPLCAQITFNDDECVRSPLALEAIKRLTPKGLRIMSDNVESNKT